ncbi:MAG: hypothetical protein Q8P83_03225 [bacterium]|nr:hypothetical protein [bacterium]
MTKIISFIVGAVIVGGMIFFVAQNFTQSNQNPENESKTQTSPNEQKKNNTSNLLDKLKTSTEDNAQTSTSTSDSEESSPDQGIDSLPPQTDPIPEPDPVTSSAPNPVTVIILADDIHADPQSITVAKDTEVTIIFRVDTKNVAYGGLDFRSPVLDTGTIASGDSKTITFTAIGSFAFTPFLPTSNTAKGYTVDIIVE